MWPAPRSPRKAGLVGVGAGLAVAVPPEVQVGPGDDADRRGDRPDAVGSPDRNGAEHSRAKSTHEPILAPRVAQSTCRTVPVARLTPSAARAKSPSVQPVIRALAWLTQGEDLRHSHGGGRAEVLAVRRVPSPPVRSRRMRIPMASRRRQVSRAWSLLHGPGQLVVGGPPLPCPWPGFSRWAVGVGGATGRRSCLADASDSTLQ